MREHGAVLSALVDGEAVDPEALRAALQQPDAVGLLVDFASLRFKLAQEDQQPSGAPMNWREQARLERRRDLLKRTLAVAAGVALAVVTGFWAGYGFPWSVSVVTLPSPPMTARGPDARISLDPCGLLAGAPASPPAEAAAVRPGASGVPPTPSRVLYLSNDVPALPQGGEED